MIRFMLDLDSRAHIGPAELRKVNMSKVENRVKQLKINHVYEIFLNLGPSYLSANFHRISDRHSTWTRSSDYNFIVPKVQGIAASTFYFTAIKEWNSLPTNIKSIKSIPQFKVAIKR